MSRRFVRPARVLVALTTVLAVSACGGESTDSKEPAAKEPVAEATADGTAGGTGAEDAGAITADDAVAAYDEFSRTLVADSVAVVESGQGEEIPDDMRGWLDENFAETQAWFDEESFASETHYYATLRYLTGLVILAAAFPEEGDDRPIDEQLLDGLAANPDDVTIDGDTATIASDAGAPVVMTAYADGWLIDGSQFDDAWFAEQGTTAEDALNS